MKCSNCGSNLQIEDSKCPYCGSMNPYFEKHREEMFRYKKDYEKTKDEVIQKDDGITACSVDGAQFFWNNFGSGSSIRGRRK